VITLQELDPCGIQWAQATVIAHHYLHKPVDQRCSLMGYSVHIASGERIGLLLFGRPEATRSRDFYGPLHEVHTGKYPASNWEVLNLARVWFDPLVQPGGALYTSTPGYTDRRGVWRSTLASTAIHAAIARVGYEYLLAHPPIYQDEPWAIRWLLSYCNTNLHRGIVYQASGFTLLKTNKKGIQTWRHSLPDLTSDQVHAIWQRSQANRRARRFRAARYAIQPALMEL
jgi:hypothetical protein